MALRPPLFHLGQVVATPTALARLRNLNYPERSLLLRHQHGDWAQLCPYDKRANEHALKHGGRIFSVYDVHGTTFWVITEADRSSTCVLLPEDY